LIIFVKYIKADQRFFIKIDTRSILITSTKQTISLTTSILTKNI